MLFSKSGFQILLHNLRNGAGFGDVYSLLQPSDSVWKVRASQLLSVRGTGLEMSLFPRGMEKAFLGEAFLPSYGLWALQVPPSPGMTLLGLWYFHPVLGGLQSVLLITLASEVIEERFYTL